MGNLPANLILFNANVLTLNPNYPKAQLVAVWNDKVLCVSGNEAIKELKGIRTKVIDCHGCMVIPGFNDAHCHLVAFANSLLTLSLDRATVRSIADIQERIRKLAQNLPPGSWIRAGGYHEFYLVEKRHLTRWDLDEATANHPVKLTHQSGRAHLLNSLGLAFAAITRETPEPPGGIIERDLETGEPNGLIYGMSDYLEKVVPPLSDSELGRGIKLVNERLLSSGITSVQDASPHNDIKRWQAFQHWKAQGQFIPRVSMMLGAEAISQFQEQGLLPKTGDRQLRLGAVKIILDETRGQLNPPQTELNQKVSEIHQSGFQVALHAVEETTVEAAYSAVEYALQMSPRINHRHRVEHCSVCTPAMARRLASLGVVVVTQPAFVYYSGERYLKTVPIEQLRHLYPIATLIKAGLKVAAGSDCPVAPPNPLSGIYGAVFRKTKRGRNLLSEERISPLESLWMHTKGAAYACFEEPIKGSIAPGKLADLVVLSSDPTEMTPKELKGPEVEMTIIGGEIVWRRGL
jgi:predicted amidohydrolase YtcJ